jgi:hypothetical protein
MPVIRIEHVAWARSIVRSDIALFQSRKRRGDIGTADDAREGKLVAILRDYLAAAPKASYKVPKGMRENSIVPRSYLQVRTTSLPAFANHRSGSATKALDDALRSLVLNGYLMDVEKLPLSERYNFHGKAYRVLSFPD